MPATVVVCPHIHADEADAICALFPPDAARRAGAELLVFHDAERRGPERAFAHCWDMRPDADVVILHADMAPVPGARDPFGWLRTLLSYRAIMPDAGMLACNLLYPDGARRGRVQHAGGTLRDGTVGHLAGDIPDAVLDAIREVPWVTFGGVLIRRAVIDAVGGFDPRYAWAYVMDVDYCLEARARGFRLFQVPAFLRHEESRTTGALMRDDPALSKCFDHNFGAFAAKWAGSPLLSWP